MIKCILSLTCIIHIIFITFLRSWVFNQPILNIRHLAQCQSMCDAQCCREIIRFQKSFAEGTKYLFFPGYCAFSDCSMQLMMGMVLEFYWTDPIDAMIRSVAKLQYQDKLYTTFKPAMAIAHPMVRAFDKANSGMVFQSAYLVDSKSSPLLALFYADASFSGQSMSHHPIYSTLLFLLYVLLLLLHLCILLQCVC